VTYTPRGYIVPGMEHDHTTMSTHDSSWRTAISATVHCLTGCAIGEVLGMVLATWWGWANVPSILLAIVLAFFFGYLLTFNSVRGQLAFGDAIKVAVAADTVSILVMELIDNAFIVAVPGALDAGLADLLFWWSLIVSLAIAFVVTVPVNRWMIGRGKGHAVVHSMH
jgi:hypothetical protein